LVAGGWVDCWLSREPGDEWGRLWLVGDIVVGIIGAIVGGWLAGLLGLGSYGLIGTIVVAFIGACILIAIVDVVTRG